MKKMNENIPPCKDCITLPICANEFDPKYPYTSIGQILGKKCHLIRRFVVTNSNLTIINGKKLDSLYEVFNKKLRKESKNGR